MGIALSNPLQIGIRFLRHPLPTGHSAFLSGGLLLGESIGLTVLMLYDLMTKAGFRLYSGGSFGSMLSVCSSYGSRPSHHFGSGVSALISPGTYNGMFDGSLSLIRLVVFLHRLSF